jgi:uncharacterized hydrophobic protein (TIGR00341 family)
LPIRLLEVVVPASRAGEIEEVLSDIEVLDSWVLEVAGDRCAMRALLNTEKADDIIDRLEETLADAEGHHIVLLPVSAIRPRPDDEADGENGPEADRIGRDEIYEEVAKGAHLTWVYLTFIALSSIVAALGLRSDDVPAIIGAMVIAPLLGPNVALSLATTLADWKLGIRALSTSAAGVALALALSIGLGLVLPIDPTVSAIAGRTEVSLLDLGLALASGGAGALAFTTGAAPGIIGVMVAVALLPPLVTAGLMLGSGYYELALSAAMLLTANLICINLAGVVTFLVRGIRPGSWYETERARKATFVAIATWIVLLAILIASIILLGDRTAFSPSPPE